METSQHLRWNSATNEKQLLVWDQIRDENFFRWEEKEKLGSLISTTISNIPSGRLLGEILTKITPRKKMMGLKYLILDHMWITKHEGICQEWHNTDSKDKVEWMALRNARWRMLEHLQKDSWRTLREWVNSLANHHVEPPWRTLVIKGW